MSSFNRVQLMGKLGADPLLTTTRAGVPCVRLRVATGGRWKDRNGVEHNDTQWHKVVVFNERTMDVVARNFHKGSPIFVEGELYTHKYNDDQGKEGYATEIVVQKYHSRGILFPPSLTSSSPREENELEDERADENKTALSERENTCLEGKTSYEHEAFHS